MADPRPPVSTGGEAGLLQDGIPVSFRHSGGARVDRLAEDAVRLLQIGSVLGREFDLGTAARMLGRQVGSLLSGVETALNAGLLSGDGPRLAFRHDLVSAPTRPTEPCTSKVCGAEVHHVIER